jgi:glycosyltransferase involved in cell wall biosynthesis
MGRRHFFTSVAANYLPKARVWARTLKAQYSGAAIHVAFPDQLPPGFRLEDEPFDSILGPEDLGIPDFDQWVFCHTLVEASTGVKGPALARLLDLPGCESVIYFDPDIVVLAPLDRLFRELESASVLLTPHLTEPEQTDQSILDNEFSVLRHGVYNLGFLAVRNDQEGRAFSSWWRDRLLKYCYDDIPNGIFTDQRWCDLAPAYFSNCRILREPIFNVCTWNLSSRKVTGSLDGTLLVNGEPVVFYHFSGLDSGAQERALASYGRDMPALWELRRWYLAECAKHGQAELGKRPWRYGAFDNGCEIGKKQRRLYRDRADLRAAFPNPFFTKTVGRSYFHWFAAEASRPEPAGAEATRHSASLGPPNAAAASRIRSSLGSAPAYRIFALLGADERPDDLARLKAMLQKSSSGAWFAVVLGDEGAELRPMDGAAKPAGRIHAGSLESALGRICAEFADQDAIVVRPSTVTPPLWDVRLAWAAQPAAAAATVSPSHRLKDASWAATNGGYAVLERETEDEDYECWRDAKFVWSKLTAPLPSCYLLRREAMPDLAGLLQAGRKLEHAFADLRRRFRFEHLRCDDLSVAVPAMDAAVGRRHLVPAGSQAGTLRSLRGVDLRPRLLHVMHGWGGGLDRWVREFCRHDTQHRHFLLRSRGTVDAFGQFLDLYEFPDESAPVEVWPVFPSIAATAIDHPGYAAAFNQCLVKYGISAVYVSSLVGHSLDALKSAPGTVAVCHDYYPFCPALNITFDSVCSMCDRGRLTRCALENPHNRFFRNVPASYWTGLREAFVQCVNQSGVTMIVPSDSVERHFAALEPRLRERFRLIPHGARRISGEPLDLDFSSGRKLRVLIPGHLTPNKGLGLVEAMWPRLCQIADVALIGCGPLGEKFRGQAAVVVPEYEWETLPSLVSAFGPHLALLPSVVPETFSFSLQEMFDLAVPVAATRLGSFEDRIEDGVNGFLCGANAGDLLRVVETAGSNRERLRLIHQRLRTQPRRSPEAMIEDYRGLAGCRTPSPAAYVARETWRHSTNNVPKVPVQCYWRRAGESFQESASQVQEVPLLAGAYRLRWDLRGAREVAEIRLNLSNRPLFAVLHELLLHLGDRTLDLAGPGCRWILDRNFVCSETLPVSVSSDGGLWLCLLGAVPQMLVPVPRGHGPAEAVSLSLRLPAPREIRQMVRNRVAAGGFLEHEAPLLEEVLGNYPLSDSEAGHVAEPMLWERLTHAERRVRDLESSLSWRITKPLRDIGKVVMERKPGSRRD